MNFGMTMLNQSTKKKQNYATWILLPLLFIFLLKTFFEDINNVVERWFDTSNYDKNDKRPLVIGKNRKVIEMFKDELGGKIMKEFCVPRAKTYAYLMHDNIEKKKAKGTKKCIIKRRLTLKNYKESIFEN